MQSFCVSSNNLDLLHTNRLPVQKKFSDMRAGGFCIGSNGINILPDTKCRKTTTTIPFVGASGCIRAGSMQGCFSFFHRGSK